MQFSASAGTLVGVVTGGVVEVPADITGRASIELTSSLQVGDAVVTAGVKNVAGLTRRLVISFVPANGDDLIRFTATPATAPADGASISTFTVRLAPSFPIGTQVTFRTTAGGFQPGDTPTATALPGLTIYRGRVTITVGVEGSSVKGTEQIEIVDPS